MIRNRENPSPLVLRWGNMALRSRLTHYAKLAAAFAVAPLVLLGLAEGGLRAAGYGHSTRPFIERTIDGQTCHTINFDFFRQFMPWWPYPVGEPPYDVVIPEKPAGSYRIAILGSSAAHGWYFPDFSFGRVLEVMLKARFPNARFEVYDLSYIAMNSHVMRYMAREAAAKIHPDLFVVYMGNNEIKGTLGVLHAMNMRRRIPMDWLVRGFVAVSDSHLVQVFTHALERLTGAKAAWAPWQSTAGISTMDDARIAAVNRNFRDNLEAICDAAQAAGASVALCTLQRNLRDYPPDQSIHAPTLAEQDKPRWESLFEQGKDKQSASDWPGALELYHQAAALDPTYAELQFRMGTCLWALGGFDEARAAFVAAQENNFGLLSANAHINTAVKETAAARAGKGVFLVDAAAELAATSPHQTPGHDLFFDHVHFTFKGSYVLARAVFERLLGELPGHIRGSTLTGDAAPDTEQCKEWLAYSDAEERSELSTVIDYLQSNKPEAARDDFVAARNRLDASIGGRSAEVDAEACRRALAVSSRDLSVRFRFVRLLLSGGHYADAEREARILLEQYPLHWRSHWALAAAQSGQGKHLEALQTAKFLTRCYSDYPETWYRCGEMQAAADDLAPALKSLRRAASMRPRDDAVRRAEAKVLGKLGRTDDAIAMLLELIALNPLQPEPYEELEALLNGVDAARSVEIWREIARKYPKQMPSHLRLARALAKNGDSEGALEEFKQAVTAEPGALWVRAEFGRFLLSIRRTEEALANLKEVLTESPDMQYIRPYLAQAMLELNNPEAARMYADEARARKEPVPVDVSPAAQALLAPPSQP